jgi:hypothetical protein
MFKSFQPYLPFIIPLIVAGIAYFFGQRTNKINRFYTQAENSLKNMIEPLYFKMKVIRNQDDEEKREILLDQFFDTQFTNKNISSIGNKYVVRWFIKLEEEYILFKKERTEERWKEFWILLDYLYNMVESEYWTNFCSLYRDYRWYQSNLTTNFLFRFWNELIRMMSESFRFLSLVLSFSVIFAVYEYILYHFFEQKRFLPEGSLQLSFILLLLIVVVLMILYICSSLGPEVQRSQESLIERFFKKIYKKDSMTRTFKNYEDKIEIPNYYKQRNP